MNKIINDYIKKSDWRVKENANTGFSLSGLRSFISSRELAIDSLSKLPSKIRLAHKKGKIHIHDLDGGLYSPYCYGADLQQLIIEGLKNPVGSKSIPAKHFDSEVDQIVNYLYMSQNEFNGAQAFSNVDTLLAPFVIGHDYINIKQNVQRLIYNLSYPLRSAFQTPFINFSFDIIPPKHMISEPCIIGGKMHESLNYGDMQSEMDLINKAFLETYLEGDSKGKPFTFPIPSYGITNELLEKNDQITDLLWQVSAKYGNPNFTNYIKTEMNPADVRSMCCRLSLDIKKIKSRGLWDMGNKTGSLGVVTINLNQASIKGYDNFIENVDNMYELAIEELEIKRAYINYAFQKGLLPFTKNYLNNKNPFSTFFNTIGIAGMNEACLNMFNTSIEFNEDVTIELLNHLRNRTDETTEESDDMYNLEETPIEGATYRLAKLDHKLGLKTQGINEHFLTNSTHCPVNSSFDWKRNIRIQEKFKKIYSGGTILHGFTGEISAEQCESYIKLMARTTEIPYYNVTPASSICENHGWFPGIKENCPTCNNKTSIYSRVVGYLQPLAKWNGGKQEEFWFRKLIDMTSDSIIHDKIIFDDDGNVICD